MEIWKNNVAFGVGVEASDIRHKTGASEEASCIAYATLWSWCAISVIMMSLWVLICYLFTTRRMMLHQRAWCDICDCNNHFSGMSCYLVDLNYNWEKWVFWQSVMRVMCDAARATLISSGATHILVARLHMHKILIFWLWALYKETIMLFITSLYPMYMKP